MISMYSKIFTSIERKALYSLITLSLSSFLQKNESLKNDYYLSLPLSFSLRSYIRKVKT